MAVDLDGIFLQNSTFNYEDYQYESEDPVTRHSKTVWIPALCSVVVFMGLLGNTVLLAVLVKKRQSWSISDTFILHQGLADILLLLVLPFGAAQVTHLCDWCFGIFCKICGGVFMLNYYCGIFLLVCISLENYLSTIHAIQLYSQKKRWLAHISCLSVWVISILLTIPEWKFLVDKANPTEGKMCVHSYSQSETDWQLGSRLLHHIVGFVLPGVMLMICCSHMLRMQCGSPGLQRQRNVTIILSLVLVFCLCWMPYNITLILDTIKKRLKSTHSDLSERPEGLIKTALLVTSALGCLHACLRPLLYLGLCRNFRMQLLAMLRCNTTEFRISLWELSLGQKALPEHRPDEGEELKQINEVQLAQC